MTILSAVLIMSQYWHGKPAVAELLGDILGLITCEWLADAD